MAKLPGNLVKAPQFDNPLRPTVPTGKVLSLAEEHAEPTSITTPTVAAPAPAPAQELDATPAPATEEALVHRQSIRFTDDQWKALQSECHRRRMNGEHTNVAELLRIIVDDWRAIAR
jgi:hypothetical protein